MTCAKAMTDQSCEDYSAAVAVAACAALPGMLANLRPCVADAQCQSGFCRTSTTHVCGACAPVQPLGGPCTDINECGGDLANPNHTPLTCSTPVAGVKSCISKAPLGSPCLGGTGVACLLGMSCVGQSAPTATNPGVPGTCTKLGATEGIACDANRKTIPECDERLGLICDQKTTTTCVRRVLAGLDEACGTLAGMDVVVQCKGGLFCLRPLDAMMALLPSGVCVPRAAVGDECGITTSATRPCGPGLKCVNPTLGASRGTCAPIEPAACY
jgi:hypothetical protein